MYFSKKCLLCLVMAASLATEAPAIPVSDNDESPLKEFKRQDNSILSSETSLPSTLHPARHVAGVGLNQDGEIEPPVQLSTLDPRTNPPPKRYSILSFIRMHKSPRVQNRQVPHADISDFDDQLGEDSEVRFIRVPRPTLLMSHRSQHSQARSNKFSNNKRRLFENVNIVPHVSRFSEMTSKEIPSVTDIVDRTQTFLSKNRDFDSSTAINNYTILPDSKEITAAETINVYVRHPSENDPKSADLIVSNSLSNKQIPKFTETQKHSNIFEADKQQTPEISSEIEAPAIDEIISGLLNPEELQAFGGFGLKIAQKSTFPDQDPQPLFSNGKSFSNVDTIKVENKKQKTRTKSFGGALQKNTPTIEIPTLHKFKLMVPQILRSSKAVVKKNIDTIITPLPSDVADGEEITITSTVDASNKKSENNDPMQNKHSNLPARMVHTTIKEHQETSIERFENSDSPTNYTEIPSTEAPPSTTQASITPANANLHINKNTSPTSMPVVSAPLIRVREEKHYEESKPNSGYSISPTINSMEKSIDEISSNIKKLLSEVKTSLVRQNTNVAIKEEPKPVRIQPTKINIFDTVLTANNNESKEKQSTKQTSNSKQTMANDKLLFTVQEKSTRHTTMNDHKHSKLPVPTAILQDNQQKEGSLFSDTDSSEREADLTNNKTNIGTVDIKVVDEILFNVNEALSDLKELITKDGNVVEGPATTTLKQTIRGKVLDTFLNDNLNDVKELPTKEFGLDSSEKDDSLFIEMSVIKDQNPKQGNFLQDPQLAVPVTETVKTVETITVKPEATDDFESTTDPVFLETTVPMTTDTYDTTADPVFSETTVPMTTDTYDTTADPVFSETTEPIATDTYETTTNLEFPLFETTDAVFPMYDTADPELFVTTEPAMVTDAPETTTDVTIIMEDYETTEAAVFPVTIETTMAIDNYETTTDAALSETTQHIITEDYETTVDSVIPGTDIPTALPITETETHKIDNETNYVIKSSQAKRIPEKDIFSIVNFSDNGSDENTATLTTDSFGHNLETEVQTRKLFTAKLPDIPHSDDGHILRLEQDIVDMEMAIFFLKNALSEVTFPNVPSENVTTISEEELVTTTPEIINEVEFLLENYSTTETPVNVEHNIASDEVTDTQPEQVTTSTLTASQTNKKLYLLKERGSKQPTIPKSTVEILKRIQPTIAKVSHKFQSNPVTIPKRFIPTIVNIAKEFEEATTDIIVKVATDFEPTMRKSTIEIPKPFQLTTTDSSAEVTSQFEQTTKSTVKAHKRFETITSAVKIPMDFEPTTKESPVEISTHVEPVTTESAVELPTVFQTTTTDSSGEIQTSFEEILLGMENQGFKSTMKGKLMPVAVNERPRHDLKQNDLNSRVEVTVVSSRKSVSVLDSLPGVTSHPSEFTKEEPQESKFSLDSLLTQPKVVKIKHPKNTNIINGLLNEMEVKHVEQNPTFLDQSTPIDHSLASESINIESKDDSVIRTMKHKATEVKVENTNMVDRLLNGFKAQPDKSDSTEDISTTNFDSTVVVTAPSTSPLKSNVENMTKLSQEENKRLVVRRFISNLKRIMKNMANQKQGSAPKFGRDLSSALPRVNEVLVKAFKGESVLPILKRHNGRESTINSTINGNERIPMSVLLKLKDALDIVAQDLNASNPVIVDEVSDTNTNNTELDTASSIQNTRLVNVVKEKLRKNSFIRPPTTKPELRRAKPKSEESRAPERPKIYRYLLQKKNQTRRPKPRQHRIPPKALISERNDPIISEATPTKIILPSTENIFHFETTETSTAHTTDPTPTAQSTTSKVVDTQSNSNLHGDSKDIFHLRTTKIVKPSEEFGIPSLILEGLTDADKTDLHPKRLQSSHSQYFYRIKYDSEETVEPSSSPFIRRQSSKKSGAPSFISSPLAV